MIRPVLLLTALAALHATPAASQSPQDQLWDAAAAGDTTVILAAVQAGAKLDSLDRRVSANGRYALNWAAWHNRPAAIAVLLRLGAEIDAANVTGFTALHHAAENGSLEAARALLKAGADFTRTTHAGATPEDVALARDRAAVLQLLVDARSGKLPQDD